MAETIESVLTFWLNDVGQKGWYIQDEALDAEITARFAPLWQRAMAGGLPEWLVSAQGTLAALLVTDQFSRNMFRGQGRAFATDTLALSIAHLALKRGDDLTVSGGERQFFYLPMMHAESISHQERSVRQFLLKMPKNDSNLLHARAHRRVIRTFGRFPYRNEALGRHSTPAEVAYLHAGGYGSTLRDMQK